MNVFYTLKQNSNTISFALFLCLVFLLIPTVTHAHHSSVTNNVSVSASGGHSETQIYTEINGEVIEDVTLSSDNEDGAVHYFNSTESTHLTDTEYQEKKELLQQLLILIALLQQQYVSLLN